MAYADCVDVGDTSHKLVRIELDQESRHLLLHLDVLLHNSVEGVGDEVHHDVQVNLFWLVSISIEELTHLHAIRVMERFKNLKFTVLIALILENFFDCHCFTCLCNCCFKDNTK